MDAINKGYFEAKLQIVDAMNLHKPLFNGFDLELELEQIIRCFHILDEEFCEIKFKEREYTELVPRAQLVKYLIFELHNFVQDF